MLTFFKECFLRAYGYAGGAVGIISTLLLLVTGGLWFWRKKNLPAEWRKLGMRSSFWAFCFIFFGSFLLVAPYQMYKEKSEEALAAKKDLKEARDQLNARSPSGLEKEISELKAEKEKRLSRQWKPLTKDQIDSWYKALVPYKKYQINVSYNGMNSEELARSFYVVSYKVNSANLMGGGTTPNPGIVIQSKKGSPAGQAVFKLFQSLYSPVTHDTNWNWDEVSIFIGEKP
jgi:hypothetical protein